MAVEETGVPHHLPVLLGSVAFAAAAGFVLVLVVGDRYLLLVGRVDNVVLSVGVLGFLCVLVVAFAGVVGLGVFAVSTLVGLVPGQFGARRMTCMGIKNLLVDYYCPSTRDEPRDIGEMEINQSS